MTEVLRVVHESGKSIAEAVPPAAEVGALLKMVEDSKISLNAAKTAFAAMCNSGKGAEATVSELGLAQVSDEGAIAAACDKIIAAGAGQGRGVSRRTRQVVRIFRRPGNEGDGRQGKPEGDQRNPETKLAG